MSNSNKTQVLNFLNNELGIKARARNLRVLKEQSQVDMIEASKIQIKNETRIFTNRPQ